MPWVDNLAKVLPKLRTQMQLTGFIVLIVGIVATKIAAPNQIHAQISAGAIGVVILVFAQIFRFLKDIPIEERVRLILILFIVFVVFVLALVGLTGYFLTQPSNASTSSNSSSNTANTANQNQPKAEPASLHIEPKYQASSRYEKNKLKIAVPIDLKSNQDVIVDRFVCRLETEILDEANDPDENPQRLVNQGLNSILSLKDNSNQRTIIATRLESYIYSVEIPFDDKLKTIFGVNANNATVEAKNELIVEFVGKNSDVYGSFRFCFPSYPVETTKIITFAECPQ